MGGAWVQLDVLADHRDRCPAFSFLCTRSNNNHFHRDIPNKTLSHLTSQREMASMPTCALSGLLEGEGYSACSDSLSSSAPRYRLVPLLNLLHALVSVTQLVPQVTTMQPCCLILQTEASASLAPAACMLDTFTKSR